MKKETDKYRDKAMGPDISDGISRISFGKRTFSSLRNPVYRLYYGGMLGQMAAMNMQMVAGSLLLYRLTGSAAILGALSFANAIPMLTLSLFGGVIADRVRKKYVLLIGQIAFAVVSLGTALALNLGYLSTEHPGSWWILVVASVFQGSIMSLAMPSRQAIINEIVNEEQLMNAISLNFMGMNALQLFAPALAGFLVDTFDFKAVYYAMTGMYLIAAVFFAFLPITGTIAIRGGSALVDIREGLDYIWHEKTIRIILLLSCFVVMLSMPYMTLMPIFTDDILKVGASGLGVLMSVSGAGAVAGSLILASLPNKKRGVMLLAGGILLSLALTAFSFSKSWPLSLVMITFVGVGGTVRMSLSNTLLQYYVEDTYRGRVMSLFIMQFGLASFGTFAAGLIAEAVGVQWAVGGFALILVLLSLLSLVFVPRLRKLE